MLWQNNGDKIVGDITMALFKTRFLIDIYELALAGASDKTIAKHLGVSTAGFCGWKQEKKLVRYALKKAMKKRAVNEDTDWRGYIRGKLPPKIQDVWDKITEFEQESNGYTKIESLLNGKGRHVRQQLLVYAMLYTGFNTSKALRKVAISRSEFNKWKENDPEFMELLDEIKFIQKDFFEEGLIKLVRRGDSPAIIHVAKTFNRDRGYGEHTELRVSGNIGFIPIPIHELDLPVEVQRILLEALREKEKMKALPEGQIPVPIMAKKHVESKEVTA